MLIAGEDEAGSSGAGSRASSEVAQSVRGARAHDLSELVSSTLNSTLIRWIVDLNFGTNVVAPKIYRDFSPKENVDLTMSDVATLVKDIGLRPTTEWIKDRFDVELEEDEFKIPTGPEGTAGVDTMNDSGQTLDGMPDAEVEGEAEETVDEGGDDDIGDITMDDEESPEEKEFTGLLKALFGNDFSEADDLVIQLREKFQKGKIQTEENSHE